MKSTDVALIGAGRMGGIHGRNAAQHPRLHLKYVVDPNPAAAEPFMAEFAAEAASLSRVLDDPDLKGVLVCSSTDQHLANALAAMEAGKAVFCEKPIDLDLAKVRAAWPKFDESRFLLGFNRRFDPAFKRLKQQLSTDCAGRLESLHIINHDPATPPPGFIPSSGGLFRDFTIHDLDLARWLLDEEPETVFTQASCLVDTEIGQQGDFDTARTVLRTASGRLCVISNTRRSGYGYDQRIEAFGSEGMICAGNEAQDTVMVRTGHAQIYSAIKPDFGTRYAAAYRDQINHFADVVENLVKPVVSYRDGVAALILAEACDQSARTGKPCHPELPATLTSTDN